MIKKMKDYHLLNQIRSFVFHNIPLEWVMNNLIDNLAATAS